MTHVMMIARSNTLDAIVIVVFIFSLLSDIIQMVFECGCVGTAIPAQSFINVGSFPVMYAFKRSSQM